MCIILPYILLLRTHCSLIPRLPPMSLGTRLDTFRPRVSILDCTVVVLRCELTMVVVSWTILLPKCHVTWLSFQIRAEEVAGSQSSLELKFSAQGLDKKVLWSSCSPNFFKLQWSLPSSNSLPLSLLLSSPLPSSFPTGPDWKVRPLSSVLQTES